MTRIKKTFSLLESTNSKAFIGYIVAGDPNKEMTIEAMHLMSNNGVDIIELGVPFSDPMAEGPSIQRGHERALHNKTSMEDIFGIVKEYRREDDKTPIVLMGYYNNFNAIGGETFFTKALNSGIDGVLIVDMPLEESKSFSSMAMNYKVDVIRLISPTTSLERSEKILREASGYIYFVSLNGVTGSDKINISRIERQIKNLQTLTDLPVVIGFGIKDKKTAQDAAILASGVVVGSVLVDIMAISKDKIKESLTHKLKELSSALVQN